MDISKINLIPGAGAGRIAGGVAARDQVVSSVIQGSSRGTVDQDSWRATGGNGAVEEAVSTIQEFAQSIRRNLSFNLDDSTGRVVVKVTDSVSGEIIRQIPSEEALKLAESLAEARSLLFKAEA